MTLKTLITLVTRRWKDLDLGGEAVYGAVNEVISEMNMRIEGKRESEICLVLSNEIVGEFAGDVDLPAGADESKYYYCHTTGGIYTAGNLYLGDKTEIDVDDLNEDDVYYSSVDLATAGWDAGDLYYHNGSAWVSTGYTWSNYRLTLKSTILKVIGIWVDEVKWNSRSYTSFDNDNNWEEYYEESRNVLRFNDYIGSSGEMRIICKTGIATLTTNPDVTTEIDMPTAWQSTFMDGVIARLSMWDVTDPDIFKVFNARYEQGLNRIEQFEANRLPYAHVRKPD
jgi:hypothetical protein